MEYAVRDIRDLRPAPYNPRKALQPGSAPWKRLERSLREFQLVQPIVWNETTGHVVAGHQRLEVLKHQGVTQVDVVVVRITIEREKALNIALNNAQIGSDWDESKLMDVMQSLVALPDFDATLTGFDDDDLKHFALAPAAIGNADDEGDQADVAESQADEEAYVHVHLEIPQEDWESVREAIDGLLEQFPLKVHVRES